ncbi:MAG TPA: hypothetical protein VK742_21215 [Candidatus Sulfotelmatobacter sp.]|jgi:uncharacterized protein YjbJ (UPF0337 family)|nr:hypothetical protein [Candidatus Sulfotelmatobacter sp.]
MKTTKFKANWNIVKGLFKQWIGHLTHDDMQFIEGKENELIGRIQKRSRQNNKRGSKRGATGCRSCGR